MERPLDVLCLSHVRWSFSLQRPNFLMQRCAERNRVFFLEEPVFDAANPSLEVSEEHPRLYRIVPHLPPRLRRDRVPALRSLLDGLFDRFGVDGSRLCLWYYTPMALPYTDHLDPLVSVYDNVEDAPSLRGASRLARDLEDQLLQRVDLVFTTGYSLALEKRSRHRNVHLIGSGVDVGHFTHALEVVPDPADQSRLSRPRFGFFGVVDERIDLALLAQLADLRPYWSWVVIGPVVGLDADQIPRRPNLHFLGRKRYRELPRYLSGWDGAFLPFALNESTRFMNGSRVLEYLAAGKQVVSTPVRDLVVPYERQGLIASAEDAAGMVAALELVLGPTPVGWVERAAAALQHAGWDQIWGTMFELVGQQCWEKRRPMVG
jgi:UDP-galactopyranose mutase